MQKINLNNVNSQSQKENFSPDNHNSIFSTPTTHIRRGSEGSVKTSKSPFSPAARKSSANNYLSPINERAISALNPAMKRLSIFNLFSSTAIEPIDQILWMKPPKSILKKPNSIKSTFSHMTSQHKKSKKLVIFCEDVNVCQTYSREEYERKGEFMKSLTPSSAALIKFELNEFKREMPVHEESRKNTQFYPI